MAIGNTAWQLATGNWQLAKTNDNGNGVLRTMAVVIAVVVVVVVVVAFRQLPIANCQLPRRYKISGGS